MSEQDNRPKGENGAGVAESEHDFLRIAKDAYRASTNYFDTSVRLEIERDIRQWQSVHWRESKYSADSYRGRSKFFRPKTRAAVFKSEAQAAEAFFSTVDVVSIVPYDKDDKKETQSADFYKALLQRRLTEPSPRGIPWYLTCMGAYQDANVTGVVVSKQYWDLERNRNRPMVDLAPLENFRFDPASDWRDPVGTSPYLILMTPMYIKDIRKRMDAGEWTQLDDSDLKMAANRFGDSIRLQREGNRKDSKETDHEVTDFSVAWVHENIVEMDGVDLMFYTLGTEKMLSEPMPIEQQYPQGRPFVVGFSMIETHKHYPGSIPRVTRDTQKEINDLANQRMDNVSFVLNKRYFVKRNRQVDLGSLMRNMPGSATLMTDPDQDVRVVETPDVTASSYAEQDRLNLDFDDVSGQFSGSSVQSNRSLNETVGGMNILTVNSNQTGAYRLRTFVETWMEPVLRQLIKLERAFEDDEVIVTSAIVQAKIPLEEIGDHLWESEASLSVNVGMGATNPQEKANMLLFGFNAIKTILADGVLEQRGLNAREAAKEIFAMIGYRDGSRFFTWADDDPVVAHLQGQIQQLQQQLDAKHPPELLRAQVDKMDSDTLEKVVRAVYSAMQAGQVIASVPTVAPVADEILKSAGYKPKAGIDPNFPRPAGPDPALTQGEVYDPRTGVGFMPGGNTNPSLPAAPAQPDAGAGAGIESQQIDGVRE